MSKNPVDEKEFEPDQEAMDFLSAAWELYRKEIDGRHPEDYEVYLPNMSKLMCTYGFLQQVAAECGGTVEELRFDRRETFGEVVAYFRVFSLAGDNLAKFCDLVKSADNLGIDALTDGTVCIGMTFKDVFRKVK